MKRFQRKREQEDWREGDGSNGLLVEKRVQREGAEHLLSLGRSRIFQEGTREAGDLKLLWLAAHPYVRLPAHNGNGWLMLLQ